MRTGAATAAAASLAMLAAPAVAVARPVAAALGERSAASTAPAPTTATPAPSAPTPPAPLRGSMRIRLLGVGGGAPFMLAREAIDVEGRLSPFAAGQRVRVTVYLDGHRQAAKTVIVRAHGTEGEFRVRLRGTPPGRVRVIAAHASTAQMLAVSASSRDLTALAPVSLSTGARGAAVWVLQRALGALHYAVPQSGYFDEATADAVIAYRKLTGLPRVSYADAGLLRRLSHGEGAFHVRFRRDGRHVEADLSTQVLAEIAAGGRVQNIYPMSSGKPSTPTVTGHFRVYEKTPGFNSEMMLDSNYFIAGYAIHGYPEVPTYAASHGCLRVPNLDAQSIYSWARIGTTVDVYD